MEIKAVINEKYKEIELHVCKNQLDQSVKDLISTLNTYVNDHYTVKAANGATLVVFTKDIISIYAENQKVLVRTMEGVFESTLKLYEFEAQLNPKVFMRISRSELVNIKKIKRLDLGITGTIKVILMDNSISYTSRRNVTKLKKALGI